MTEEIICGLCDAELDEDERESPHTSDGSVVCDDCYHHSCSYACGLCEGSESNDIPWSAVVIGSDADEVGLTPGIYQIIRWPFVVSNTFSQRVIYRSLIHVADAPDHVYEGGEPLCQECTVKAIVRRTRSGRWRVTTTYWRCWHWWTKTRVYRTKGEAIRRARAYVYERKS